MFYAAMPPAPLSLFRNGIESGKQSLYPDSGPDRHQNLISCSPARQPSLKISPKSVWQFLHKVANKQTNRQTPTKTYPPWRR